MKKQNVLVVGRQDAERILLDCYVDLMQDRTYVRETLERGELKLQAPKDMTTSELMDKIGELNLAEPLAMEHSVSLVLGDSGGDKYVTIWNIDNVPPPDRVRFPAACSHVQII